MLVQLSDIDSEPREISFSLTGADLPDMSDGPNGFELDGPVTGVVDFVRRGDKIKARGKASGSIKFCCHRCLNQVKEPVELNFDIILVLTPPQDQIEYGPTGEELDYGFIEGEEIDLSDIIAEQLVLSRPMVNLCRQDCGGLCPTCGADLNQGGCDCADNKVDPRWATLGQWAKKSPLKE